jgi:hypothetical protein
VGRDDREVKHLRHRDRLLKADDTKDRPGIFGLFVTGIERYVTEATRRKLTRESKGTDLNDEVDGTDRSGFVKPEILYVGGEGIFPELVVLGTSNDGGNMFGIDGQDDVRRRVGCREME